jgi:hypothetical protein
MMSVNHLKTPIFLALLPATLAVKSRQIAACVN